MRPRVSFSTCLVGSAASAWHSGQYCINLGEIQIQIQNQKYKNHQHMPDISIRIEMKIQKHRYLRTPGWQYWINSSEAKKIRKTKTLKYMYTQFKFKRCRQYWVGDYAQLYTIYDWGRNLRFEKCSIICLIFLPVVLWVICTSTWCQTQSTIFGKY